MAASLASTRVAAAGGAATARRWARQRATVSPKAVQQVDAGDMAVAASSLQQQRYAFVMLGGVRKLMQEGQEGCCPRRYLNEARVPAAAAAAAAATAAVSITASSSSSSSSSSDRYIFCNVLGVRSDGVFRWGRPFVPHAAVEVELLEEEFQGPVPLCSIDVQEDDVTMTRYRVKHIDARLGRQH